MRRPAGAPQAAAAVGTRSTPPCMPGAHAPACCRSVSSSACQTAAAAAPGSAAHQARPRARAPPHLQPPRPPSPQQRWAAARAWGAAPRELAGWAPGGCGHSRGSRAPRCPASRRPPRPAAQWVGGARGQGWGAQQTSSTAAAQGLWQAGRAAGEERRLAAAAAGPPIELPRPQHAALTCSISTASLVVTALAPRHCCSEWAVELSSWEARCAAARDILVAATPRMPSGSRWGREK